MLIRMRLLKGANVLLYVGPLVAGMSGFGWGMVASFTAIFILWLLILRPEQWPASREEWHSGSAWLSVLTLVLSQVALICVLFAVGRGIGALAGYIPMLTPAVPLAISFLAIPLCRMLWDPRTAASDGYFLDEAAEAANAPRAVAEAASAVVPLLNLSDDAPDAQVSAAVAVALSVPSAELRLNALVAALGAPTRNHAALRRALVIWASEPEVVAPGRVPTSMASAFAITGGNADLLRLYLPRAMALISAFPDRAFGFPAPALLRAAATEGPGSDPLSDLPAHLRADLREGLQALARAVERALPDSLNQHDPRRDPAAKPTATHA